MLFATLITAALFTTCTYAAPAASSPPFEITDLTINKTTSANITLSFTVHDPDPLTNATAICTGTWKAGTQDYPHGPYELCDGGNSTFAWNMQTFTNARTFVLGLEHRFEDPAVGDPPYNQITNFAKANVSEPTIRCEGTTGGVQCVQDESTTIRAGVYASIA